VSEQRRFAAIVVLFLIGFGLIGLANALDSSWPLFVSALERERAASLLASVGGERLIDAPLRGLSGGELQRVFLARALCSEPKLLLLDEPTAGVDEKGRGEFLELLAGIAARTELAAVLVTHSADAIRRLAERVIYLDRVVRAWGPPAEVLEREWERGSALGGHDHDTEPGARCESA